VSLFKHLRWEQDVFNQNSTADLAGRDGGPKTNRPTKTLGKGSLPLSERVRDWLEANALAILAAVGLMIVGGLIYGGVEYWKKQQEQKAAAALYPIESEYSKKKMNFDRARFSSLLPNQTNAGNKPPETMATGDLQKDYGAEVSGFEKILSAHSGTAAGLQAAITLAGLYLEYNMPEKASQVLDQSIKDAGGREGFLTALASMQKGTALAAQDKCQDAVQTWQAVAGMKSMQFLHAEAHLKSGLCFEKLGDRAKAEESYRKVTEGFEGSTSAETAKALLRSLAMQKGATP